MKKLLFLMLGLFILGCGDTQKESNNATKKSTNGYTNLTIPAFEAKFKTVTNAVLLDIRTPQEIEKGTIQGSITIDFYDSFESKLETLDKSKTYFVFCAAGARSEKACNLMVSKGFKKIYNLETGYNGWMENRRK
jgi:rhodanese-related sulfurtransferase